MIAVVYTLRDGLGNVRYVGMSREPVRRERNYRKGWAHTKHLRNWIRSVGSAMQFVVVETMEGDDAFYAVRERYWVAHYKALGANLINYTLGGEVSFQWTEEYRALLSSKLRAWHATHKKPPVSEETRRRISVAQKGKKRPWTGPRFAELNRSRRGIPLSAEHKAKVSASLQGRKMLPHVVELVRQRAIAAWKDPEFRRVRLENLRKGGANPAGREASAAKRRGIPLTPEHRAKVSAGHKGKWGGKQNPGLAAYWAARKAAGTAKDGGSRTTISESG